MKRPADRPSFPPATFFLVAALSLIVLVVPQAISAAPLAAPAVSVSPSSGPAGSQVTVSGSGFTPGTGTLRWDGADQKTVSINQNGGFSTSFKIPNGAAPGGHTITVCWGSPCAGGEFEESASTSFKVQAQATKTPQDTPTPSNTPVPTKTFTPTVTWTPSITPTPSDTPTPTHTLTPSLTPTPTPLPVSGACSGPPGDAVVIPFDVGVRGFVRDYFRYDAHGDDPGRDVYWSEGMRLERYRGGGYVYLMRGPAAIISPERGSWTVAGVMLGRPYEDYDARSITLQAFDSRGRLAASASYDLPGGEIPFDHCLLVAAPDIARVRLVANENSYGRGLAMWFDDFFFVPSTEEAACRDQIRFTEPEDGSVEDSWGHARLRGELITGRFPAEFFTDGNHVSLKRWRSDRDDTFGITVHQDAADPTLYRFTRFVDLEVGDNTFNAGLPEESCAYGTADGGDTLTVHAEATPTPTLSPTPTLNPTPVHAPTVFRIEEVTFTQHGVFDDPLARRALSPFDLGIIGALVGGEDKRPFNFPDYMVARKDGALRVKAFLSGDVFGLTPVAVYPIELHIDYADGTSAVYQAHHRDGPYFRAGAPFGGFSEMYFLIPGGDAVAGTASFELVFHWSGSVVYRQVLGQGAFQEVPPQNQFYTFIDSIAPGDLTRYYTEVTNAARAYPVANYAAPFGSPLAAGASGIVHQLAPEPIVLPRGESPYGIFLLLFGITPGYSFQWDFIQDDAEERIILERRTDWVVDCNGDGEIDTDDRELGWLIDEDGDGAFDPMDSGIPRGALLGNWWQPEDADDDGTVSEEELAYFVGTFYDLDGTGRWYDYRDPANRSRFTPGDPYLNFYDEDNDCRLDSGEGVSQGELRKDNLWSYMRDNSEDLMLDFAARNGLEEMVTTALLGDGVKLGWLRGNCGAGTVCWADLKDVGMTPGHEIGHFWGLSHEIPINFPEGAANLFESRWIEGEDTHNLMFSNIGQARRENFLSASRFEELFDRGRGGWTIRAAAPEGNSSPGLALQQADTRALFVSGVLTREGEVALKGWYPLQAKAISAPQTPADVIVRLLDEGGETISERALQAPFALECHDCPAVDREHRLNLASFNGVIPYPQGAATLHIVYQGEVRLERSISASEPSITVGDFPEEVSRDAALLLDWEGVDSDDDALTYNLAYSADGGDSFHTFAAGLEASEYQWDPARFPGGQRVILRVSASDGFHVVSADWPAFALADAPPQLAVLTPEEGAVLERRSRVVLHAAAVDLEDGPLDGSQVEWRVLGGPVLGQGARVNLEELPPGDQVIVVRAADSGGHIVEDTVEVKVVTRPALDPLAVLPLTAEIRGLDPVVRPADCAGGPLQLEINLDEASSVPGSARLLLSHPDGHPLSITLEAGEGEGEYRASFGFGEDAPLGEWRLLLTAIGKDGVERRAAPRSFELVSCSPFMDGVRAVGNPLVLVAAAAGVLGLSALAWVLVSRRSKLDQEG